MASVVAEARAGMASRTTEAAGSSPSSSPSPTSLGSCSLAASASTVPSGVRSSRASSVSVMQTAPLRRSRWHPTEDMEVTGPGTAPTCLPSSRARWAVDRAPDRQAASTTIVACEIAAMTRLRETNR